MSELTDSIIELEHLIGGMDRVAVAVSGGVDSLTLATLVQRQIPQRSEMHHAVSPAVPAEATDRVRLLAGQQAWSLKVVDAGEFDDVDYRANPVNRCFYCKTNLYGAIARNTTAQIVSGTNLDDLGEYRPGLEAAKRHSVRHPFVEAGVDKATVRLIAKHLGLADVAELPSAPCLSSRIETGIAIDPAMLALVHQTEKLIGNALHPKTVRCRVRANGVVVELDNTSLASADSDVRTDLGEQIAALFSKSGFDYPVRFESYRVGSAFVQPIRLM